MAELAMSSMQVAEEVMKESVAAYLDAPKSANSEILRRLINVILHRLSVVVNNLVIALEVPNAHNPAKLDILRIRVEQFSISDSSQENSYTQALDISYSAVYNRSEKKTAKIRSFSVELFEIDESEKSEILHLTSTRAPVLSIPETTELNLELSMQPFSVRCAVNLEHVNIGLDSTQIGIIGSLTQKLNETLSKVPPPSAKPTAPSAEATSPTSKPNADSKPPGPTAAVSHPSRAEETDDDDEFDDAEGDGSDYGSDYDSSDDDNSSAVLVIKKPVADNPSASHNNAVPVVNMRASETSIMNSQNETVFGRRENLSVDISVCVSFLQLAAVPTSSKSSEGKKEVPPSSLKSPTSPVSGLASSASSLASAMSSPAPSTGPSSPSPQPHLASDTFTLESLAEPSKLNQSFVLLRFKDLAIKSSQDAGGNSRIRATLNAFAVHENYKVDPVEFANVPENCVLGETGTAGYLTYPVIRIHPHSHSKAPKNEATAAGPPNSAQWALRLRHAIEHKIPTTDIDVDQISVTLPGKLPKLLAHLIDDLGTAFSGPKSANGSPISSTPVSARSSSSSDQPVPGTGPSSLNASSKAIHADNDKRRFLGLVDSSSSSEPEGANPMAAPAPSIPANEPAQPKLETISEDERDSDEEAPPPTKRTIKIGHVFVSLRVPISTANRYSFPVFRKEFIAAYIKRPIATLYSSSQPSPPASTNGPSAHQTHGDRSPDLNGRSEIRRSIALPNDTVEFETLSLFLLNNIKDITILARSPDAGHASNGPKRYSGSDAGAGGPPKWFLKFTASSSSDIRTEAVSIQRNPTTLPPLSTSSHMPGSLGQSKAQQSDLESSSAMSPLGPSMTVLQDYSGTQKTYMSANSSRSGNGGDMGASTVPKFVQQTFESAPFSSVTARFEGETQVPRSMDDESYHAFLTRIMAHSDLAVTVAVHELELELEKSQADLIQELIDGMTASPKDDDEELSMLGGLSEEEIEAEKAAREFVKMSQANAAAAIASATGALFSGFALELRVSFASIRLTTASASAPNDKVDYRFSNVETLRVLFVSQYLHTAKTFVVIQVDSLRLPSIDALPNTPPILSKIPEFGYEEAKVLTIVVSMESLASYWKKRSSAPMVSNFRRGSSSPSNSDVDEDDIASRMTILVEPHRLAIEYRLGERWIGDLGGFFVRDVPVDLSRPKQEVLLFVHARSSSVALRGNIATSAKRDGAGTSNVADPVALVHLEKLVVTSRFVMPTDPLMNNSLTFNFRAHMAQLFIIDDKGRVWLKPSEGAHVKTTRQYWIARGYSPCGFIESLFSKITTNSLSLPKLSIDLNLNATLDTTGDQLFAVTQLLSSLSASSPESLAAAEESEKDAEVSSKAPIRNTPSTNASPPKVSVVDLHEPSSSQPVPSRSPPPKITVVPHDTHSMDNGLVPFDHDEEEDEEEIIFQGGSSIVSSRSQSPVPQNEPQVGEEYVLVRMTPAQQQAHQRELEREEWLKTFKLSQRPPPMAPTAVFVGVDNEQTRRMPRLIEDYKPSKIEEQAPSFSFVFNLASSEFIIHLREGFALLEEEDTSTANPTPATATSDAGASKPSVGARRDYRDVLSNDHAPHVAVHLRGFRVSHTNDDLDQSETKLTVKKFFFKSSRDGPAARPFVDFDRGALSNATHMLSLTLSSMYNLGDDSPALHQQRPISSKERVPAHGGNATEAKMAHKSIDDANKDDSEMSSILIFNLLPLAIRVDIDALEFIRTFYATFSTTQPALAAHMAAANPSNPSSAPQSRAGSASAMSRQRTGSSSKLAPPASKALPAPAAPAKRGTRFHRVSISSISLNLNVSAWALRMDDAIIQLPSLYCRGVDGWDGVGAELSAAYQPLLYSSLFTFAGSLPVVRLVLSVLGSVSNLVISPYEEYQRGRSPASGAYGAITVGATSVASELLRFGAWVSSSAGDGLQYLESFWRRPDTSKTAAPSNLQQGAQLGYSNMVRQVAAARDCLVVMPWKEYKRHQSVIGLVAGVASAVPLAILKPVIGATHGISNVMQGASNAIHVPGRAKDYARGDHTTSTSPSAAITSISPSVSMATSKKPSL